MCDDSALSVGVQVQCSLHVFCGPKMTNNHHEAYSW
jgi:hypothetical protein